MKNTTIRLTTKTKEEMERLFPRGTSSEEQIKGLIQMIPIKVKEMMIDLSKRYEKDELGLLFGKIVMEHFAENRGGAKK